MKVLVIGGTQFVGRYLVESLLADGAEVTLFHRGKTNKGLFEGVAEVYGDRNEGFEGLGNGPWDAVVDTCAYTPGQSRGAAGYFRGKAEHFVFVSTISVYDKEQEYPVAEDGVLLSALHEDAEVTGETYGRMKVACEEVLEEEWEGALTHVRPGVVLGPHDPTGRFAYWPLRFSLGGRVVVPDVDDEKVTGIDVRDLGDFMALVVKERITGTYNADNLDLRFGEIVSACEEIAVAGTETVRVEADRLKGVSRPWADLPIWSDGAITVVDPRRAMEQGLGFRPIEETVEDTLVWVKEAGLELPLKGSWGLEDEAKALSELGL